MARADVHTIHQDFKINARLGVTSWSFKLLAQYYIALGHPKDLDYCAYFLLFLEKNNVFYGPFCLFFFFWYFFFGTNHMLQFTKFKEIQLWPWLRCCTFFGSLKTCFNKMRRDFHKIKRHVSLCWDNVWDSQIYVQQRNLWIRDHPRNVIF